jgi:hypothetical protein
MAKSKSVLRNETAAPAAPQLKPVYFAASVEHYVGIDVSLELSSVCVVDGRGKIVKDAKVASEPEAPCLFLQGTWLSSESDWV